VNRRTTNPLAGPAAASTQPTTILPTLNNSTPDNPMAKTQNSQKQTKKQPLKTPAQKKADKRDKKNAR